MKSTIRSFSAWAALALLFVPAGMPAARGQFDLGIPVGVLLLRSQVDEMLKAANHAVDTFAKESKAWRKAMDDMHDKLKATGQELLANDLREFSRRAISDVGGEIRFNIEFIEAKSKRYLVSLRDAVGKAKNKLLLTADLKTAQEIVAGIVRDLDTEMTPAVPSFSPSVVRITWKDHATPKAEGVPGEHIAFSGYALRPKNDKDLRLEILGEDGKPRRDATHFLTIHTPYTASIDLSATGLQFGATDAGDRRLRLVYKGETVGEIKLQWGQRPPVPPKVVNLRAHLHTQTHREAAGQVELVFFHKDRRWGDSLHRQMIPMPWGLPPRPYDGHIGAYRVWEKGHREDFVPPKGLGFQPEYKEGDEVKVQIALGAVPGERNINWRGDIEFFARLDDGREVPLGSSGGFWFRNNVVEDPQNLRGNRVIERVFRLPPLPPTAKK